MRLLSCTGCISEGRCERALNLRESLQGMMIRTVKFGCPIREDRFKPGQPVIFTIKISRGDDEGGMNLVYFEGFAIEHKGSRLFGFIKPGSMSLDEEYSFEGTSNGYVKVPLARVRADASRQPVSAEACRWCNNHPQMGAACNKDPEHTGRNQCLAEKLA